MEAKEQKKVLIEVVEIARVKNRQTETDKGYGETLSIVTFITCVYYL